MAIANVPGMLCRTVCSESAFVEYLPGYPPRPDTSFRQLGHRFGPIRNQQYPRAIIANIDVNRIVDNHSATIGAVPCHARKMQVACSR